MPDTWTEQEKQEALRELDEWFEERRRWREADADEERGELDALQAAGER